MEPTSQLVRSPQQILADGLYPDPEALEPHDRRHQAVAEVLCRLPEDVYEQVKRIKLSKRSFEWFIPALGTQGLVYPFVPNFKPRTRGGVPVPSASRGMWILGPYTRVIYLSPLQELRGWDSLVLVAAHELAHVVLNHPPICHDQESDRCEREVFRLVCEWGFDREARREEATCKAIEGPGTTSDALAPLAALLREAGIETVPPYEEEQPGEACIEFAGAGDAELFLNIARRAYKVEVIQWDEGGDGEHLFRVRLVVSFPTGDVPGLSAVFIEHNRSAGTNHRMAQQ
jgi:hypothetical protein